MRLACKRAHGPGVDGGCLEHVIMLNEVHPHRILTDYFDYYHDSRPPAARAKPNYRFFIVFAEFGTTVIAVRKVDRPPVLPDTMCL